ncbi:MAG: hypothetical protein RLZZ214_3659 [Verrucomicrobiota bacterium]|jgi:autotransporter-associated beta strand protein
MDQEIAYAKNAGIDYWAFIYYDGTDGLALARTQYLASAHRDDVSFSIIMAPDSFKTPATAAKLIDWFKLPCHQKVIGGRPLFYLFNTTGLTVADVTNFRNTAIAAGAGNPYIVTMGRPDNPSTLGLDATSNYGKIDSWDLTYAGYSASIVSLWEDKKNIGAQVIPCVATSVDKRPRGDNEISWEPLYRSWVQQPTPTELANEVQNAINWVTTNSANAAANSVLIYAWNEFDEGGWICPTLYSGADRLNALANVLGGTQQATAAPPTPGPNLALNRTASASTRLSPNVASRAVDGDMSTSWLAANNNATGAWLAVDLGVPTTFNRVVIREASLQRITGYKIQYDSGNSTWVDLVTGTTPGPYAPEVFQVITAQKLRVLVTAATGPPRIDELEVYYQPNFQPTLSGLSCEWNFDGDVYDRVGSRHALLNSSTTYHHVGVSGKALQFDGVKSSVVVPDTDGSHTAPLDALGAFTVAAWVRLDQRPALPCRIVNKSGQYALTVNPDGSGTFALATSSAVWGSAGTSAAFSSPLSRGVWHHLAGVYDGSLVKVYVNGQLAGTGSQSISGSLTNTNADLLLGTGSTGVTAFLKGGIDDLCVFKRALDAMEVRELRDDSRTDASGNWLFDEGGGTVSADSSGHANRAALVNGAAWSAGILGQGVNLDGVDDFVEMPDRGALGGMDTLTVSAWINLASLPATGFSITPLQKQGIYRIKISPDGTGNFAVGTANYAWNSAGTSAASSTALSLNSWHHLTGTYDGSRVRIYVDGVLRGTGMQEISGAILNSPVPLRLGQAEASDIVSMTGTIDQVQVRSRALSDAEVLVMYQADINASNPVVPAVELVTNGDFSANASSFVTDPGDFGVGSNPASAPAWTTTVGTGINGTLTPGLDSHAPSSQLPSFLFMRGSQSASQALATVSGKSYLFGFDAAAKVGDISGVSVFADNTQAASLVLDANSSGWLSPSAFQHYAFAFMGTGPKTIQFNSNSSGVNQTTDITSVSVTEVSSNQLNLVDETMFFTNTSGTHNHGFSLTGANQTFYRRPGSAIYTGDISTDNSTGALTITANENSGANNLTFSGSTISLNLKDLIVTGQNVSFITEALNSRFTLNNTTLTTSGNVDVARGTLEITGNTSLAIGGQLRSGLSGEWATFIMNPGTSVTATGGVDLRANSTIGTRLDLNGGILTTPFIRSATHYTDMTLNGTKVVASADSSNFLQVYIWQTQTYTGSVKIKNGGAAFDTNGKNITIQAPLVDSSGQTGSLTKQGAGTLTLSGQNTYSGNTTVTGGSLAVNGSSIKDANKLILSGGTVALTGAETVNTLWFGTVQQSPGSYLADGVNFTGSGTLVVTSGPAAGYASWMAPFITGGLTGDTTPDGDPDDDNMKNLLEYVLNGNPAISESAIQPNLVAISTDVDFTYSRRDASLTDTTQTFEYGSTLSGWTPVRIPAGLGVSSVGIATVTITDTGTTDQVKVSLPKSASVGEKLFVRLQVIK